MGKGGPSGFRGGGVPFCEKVDCEVAFLLGNELFDGTGDGAW